MGACNFIVFKEARNVVDAFNELVAEAVWEHGHDPYNGTISTTRLRKGYVQVSEKWSDMAREAAYEVAEADDWGDKRESRAIYCGLTDNELPMWAFYGWAAI